MTSTAPIHSDAAVQLTLARCGNTVVVDQLTSQHHHEAFQLVCDAAQRTDNIGVDEYPTIRHFEDLVNRSKAALGLFDVNNGHLVGVVIVAPCIYGRSPNPTLCSVTVITSRHTTDQGWRDVIDIATDAARRLPEMYSACVIDVFVVCVSRMLALRDAGFIITACIPFAGKVAGIHGYVANYLMYKDLGNVPRPPILSEVDEFGCQEVYHPQLVDSPSLPSNLTMSDGTQIIMRCMRHEDIPAFIAALKADSAAGQGYGYDELSNLDFFMRYYVDGYRNVVAQMAQTGDVVAYVNYGPTPFARTVDPIIIDNGNITISPQYRDRKWQRDFAKFNAQSADTSLSHIKGYQGDMAVTSLATHFLPMWMNYTVNGILPRAIYFKDHGWVDVLLSFRHNPCFNCDVLAKL